MVAASFAPSTAMKSTSLSICALVCALIAFPACDVLFGDGGDIPRINIGPDSPIGPDGIPMDGSTVGEACTGDAGCRDGLACVSDTCTPAGTSNAGDGCVIDGECAEGLACDPFGNECAPRGEAVEGGTCDSPVDCVAGLRCRLAGFTGVCVPDTGTGDTGDECDDDGDCLAPMGCSMQGFCQLPTNGGIRLDLGTQCLSGPDLQGEFRVLFEVPGDEEPQEFFRLPFPNDIKARDNGGLDLRGFHNPGLNVLGGEFVDLYINAAAEMSNGFSTNPTVFFRFSGPYDFGSVDARGNNPSLRLVNITPGSPDYGNMPALNWGTTDGRGKFICHNYVAVRSSFDTPLRHGETYAAWLTTDTRSNTDVAPVQDTDFRAMMSAEAPLDSALREAWERYAPLRDFYAAEGIDPATIAGAAVFTTMDPDANLPAIRAGVRAEDPPELENLTLCDGTTPSPCDPNGPACEGAGGMQVFEATYEAPVFQQGTRPYLTAADGGAFSYRNGQAEVHGTETMCVAFAVPEGAMPAGGWPTILYGHGTGGSRRSHVTANVAGVLTAADTPFVVVGIDGVMHGNRRGGSTIEPDNLFFNFLNPAAARGNVEQGAADFFVLTQLLEGVSLDAGESPTGSAFSIDTSALYFYGHSQGSTVGTAFFAHEPNVQAAVLSGAGGGLIVSLLNKTSPVDISAAVELVMNERVTERHPFLNMLQTVIDPVDALNYGRLLYREPAPGMVPRSVLQTWGEGDTYTPPATLEALALAIGHQVAEPVVDPVDGLSTTSLPASANRNGGATGILLQARSPGFDGHFVNTRDADTIRRIAGFFASHAATGTATVEN